MNTLRPIKYLLAIVLAGLLSFYSVNACSESNAATLCRADETTIFAFKISNKRKYMAICQEPKEGYLVYRYGTPGNIELQYPEILNEDSWKSFKFYGYSRGGGVENDAMGDYYLSFENNGVEYTVTQGWRLARDEYSLTLLIDIGEKRIALRGDRESQLGSLVRLESKKKLKNKYEE